MYVCMYICMYISVCGCGCMWVLRKIKMGNIYRTGMIFPVMFPEVISHGNIVAVIISSY